MKRIILFSNDEKELDLKDFKIKNKYGKNSMKGTDFEKGSQGKRAK